MYVRCMVMWPNDVCQCNVGCSADLAHRYHVSKYPTLKLFRFGQPTKSEYRGQRSVSSIASYVEDQLRDPLNTVDDVTDLDNLDVSSPAVRRLVSTLNCAEYLSVFMVALWAGSARAAGR